MAVPTKMADLSTTADSNSPAGSESPISTDNFHRAIQSILRHTNAKGADIASAATTDIGAATGEFVDVTGTTTITGLGTIATGIVRTVRFTGALTLTHNATSLILPGGANITTAANDIAVFRSLGSGNWICVDYNGATTNARLANAYINDLTTVTIASGDSVAIADASDSGNKKKALVSDILKIAPAFSAYGSVSQGVVSGTPTRVNLGTESYDTNTNFTSNRFTPTVAGYYLITGQIRGSATNLTAVAAYIYVNGSSYRQGGTINIAAATTTETVTVSDIVFLNGSTDYVELYGAVSGSSPEFNTASSAQTSYLSGVLVRM